MAFSSESVARRMRGRRTRNDATGFGAEIHEERLAGREVEDDDACASRGWDAWRIRRTEVTPAELLPDNPWVGPA